MGNINLKFAVEQRGDRWMAQLVSVGHDVTFTEYAIATGTIDIWVKEQNIDCEIKDSQYYFKNKKDMEWFLLRWS